MLPISCPQDIISLASRILVLLLLVCNLANGLDTQIFDTRDDSLAEKRPVRRLAAAHKRNLIQYRDTEQVLRYDHELYYLEESLVGPASPLSASVRIEAKRPTLALETLEHHIEQIECSEDKIFLDFATLEALNEIHRHVDGASDFYIITSHESCDIEGERNVRRVSTLTVDSIVYRMEIVAVPVLWKDSYRSMKVDFGASKEDMGLRRHEGLRKRREATASATASATIRPSAAFPVFPSSSPTPTSTKVTEKIDFNYQDTQILPPIFPGVDSLSLNAPMVPDGISFGCKNCTVHGNIVLSQGTFTVNNDNDDLFFKRGIMNTTEAVVDFFDDGFVEFEVLDFAAHIELESAVTRAQELLTFNIPFPNITLTPFQIPGVASVGPIFSPNMVVGAKLQTDLTFTYGFDLNVPNKSTIILDIDDVTNSSITGFSDTNITALPFQSEFNEISLTLFAAFQPQLLMGITVFEGAGMAGAGAYMHLPEVSATISQVANVDSECKPVKESTNASSRGFLDDIHDSLTHVTSSVNLAVGVVAEANVNIGNYLDHAAAVSKELWATSYPLPTACYSFDPEAKSYGSPTQTATATSTAGAGSIDIGAKGGAASAASKSKVSPMGKFVGQWGIFGNTFIVLACVSAVFWGL